ncbi:hypothetical protein [Sorangium sp. So ce542]|uniref:hypothetical protein n=1 Tax=Sorangium sp. So ce542 TaxID=3133316 RepID=UPI003F64085A
MERGYLLGSCAAVLCALCASACGGSASNLRPGAITKDQGAIFGRVRVLNRGKDITGDCDVYFGGDEEARRAQPDPPPGGGDAFAGRFSSSAGAPGGAGASIVSLDETGWIFTTRAAGKAHLKQVSCSVGSLAKTPLYTGSDLGFIVEGGDRIAYFGDIVVESHIEEQSDAVGASVLLASAGGLIGAAIAGAIEVADAASRSAPQPAELAVADRFGDAVRELKSRYGEEGGALKPYPSLAGGGLFAGGGEPPSSDPPTTAAGFTLGQDIGAAQARCTGAGLEWQDLGEGRSWCGGAPVDPGVPATVKLTACAGKVCEISLDAGADGAAWATLSQRFNKLSRSFEATFGTPAQRRLDPIDGCTDGIKACFDAGRARRGAAWSWPGGRYVSMSLHGGAGGDAPRLVVVYGTAAQADGKR